HRADDRHDECCGSRKAPQPLGATPHSYPLGRNASDQRAQLVYVRGAPLLRLGGGLMRCLIQQTFAVPHRCKPSIEPWFELGGILVVDWRAHGSLPSPRSADLTRTTLAGSCSRGERGASSTSGRSTHSPERRSFARFSWASSRLSSSLRPRTSRD